ncbi:hypothetical protein KAR91_47225, partial [Candidatus Pacearchaeota archaeon]|nr:hypothetical protein [Candidatus Pacearchaeota archaeon]
MGCRRKLFSLFLLVLFSLAFTGSVFGDNSSQPPLGYDPVKGSITGFEIMSDLGDADILLIETALPWDSNANTEVLNSLGYTYNKITMAEVSSTNIDGYQVVMIVNDQVQLFYDQYAQNYDKFERYVESGGTLLFFACDHGWANGDNYTDLPGGVEVGDRYNNTNIITNDSHYIITQVLTNHPDSPLTNADMDGTLCSHNYFVESTLPQGSDIIFRTDDSDQHPTFVAYPLGSGHVIASGLTWEYTYGKYPGPSQQYGFGRALPDVFKYTFSISGQHKISGLNVDIYPEDYWSAKREEVYKHKEDLIDLVACISNNITPEQEQSGVDLALGIDASMVKADFLVVYKRAAAEEKMERLSEGNNPANYSDEVINGVRTISIHDLTIKKASDQQWNDFVFRFKLEDNIAKGTKID